MSHHHGIYYATERKNTVIFASSTTLAPPKYWWIREGCDNKITLHCLNWHIKKHYFIQIETQCKRHILWICCSWSIELTIRHFGTCWKKTRLIWGVLVLLKFYWALDIVEFVLGRFSHFNIAIAYSNSTFCGAWTPSFCEKFQQNEHTPAGRIGNWWRGIAGIDKTIHPIF